MNIPDFIYSKVVSFDVGIKHLSICQLDLNRYNNTYVIKKWTVICLRGKNISDYTRDLIDQLRMFDWGLLDYILIEQQLNRNTQMKVLSHIIQAFFLCERRMHSERVRFVNPKLKFATSNPIYNELVASNQKKLDSSLKLNLKKLSVLITRDLLTNSMEHKWLSHLNEYSKRDDLCDSFLQAYAWNVDLKHGVPVEIDMSDI